MTTYQRTTKRVARKRHRCGDCGGRIQPGEVYLEHVVPPGYDDLDNRHWWHLRECVACATTYGRVEAVAS